MDVYAALNSATLKFRLKCFNPWCLYLFLQS